MNKNNELISEVQLERLGADILTEVVGFNQDTTCEYVEVEKVNEAVLSNIADSMIVNHAIQLADFLLWKQSYKEQIEDTTYQSMLDTVTYNLTHELSNYIWDDNSEKYLLKTPEKATDSKLEFIGRVIEYIFNHHSDSPYMFVRKRDIELDLNKDNDKALYNNILTIFNQNTDMSKLNDDKLIYSVIPIVNEYLKSKGYYFDKDEDRYYIPIDEDKKYSILKDTLENHFISYSENKYGFIVSTKEGDKEVYIDSCSQYTVSDEGTAYHYNEEREFLLALDKISVRRIPYLEQKKFTLRKFLDKNNIPYSNENKDEFVVNTNNGPLMLYVDSNGFYCSENPDGYGECEKFIRDFIERINITHTDNEGTTDNTTIESSYVTLECTTHFNERHSWVLHETRTFNDLKDGGCIDGHLQILDLKNSMKIVSDKELNELGYDDVWDVEWVVINQSSNKIAN